jgi:alkylation response protein AidB-like acyl-CoA dehydrogenase
LCSKKEWIQSYKEQAKHLAGPIALLKMYATQTAQETARDAVQIFGGRGITRTGMGRFVEHVSKTGFLVFTADQLIQIHSITER